MEINEAIVYQLVAFTPGYFKFEEKTTESRELVQFIPLKQANFVLILGMFWGGMFLGRSQTFDRVQVFKVITQIWSFLKNTRKFFIVWLKAVCCWKIYRGPVQLLLL